MYSPSHQILDLEPIDNAVISCSNLVVPLNFLYPSFPLLLLYLTDLVATKHLQVIILVTSVVITLPLYR